MATRWNWGARSTPISARRAASGSCSTARCSAIEVCFAEGATPFVSVFAEDALMRLRLADRTATYTDMSDADIVTEVARAHGLSAETDLDGPTYPLVQQWEESDLAFLRDRALRLDAEVWADHDDVIHVAGREQRPRRRPVARTGQRTHRDRGAHGPVPSALVSRVSGLG